MKLGVLCFVVVAAGTARGALDPAGPHVCLHNEKYIDVVQELEPVTVTEYTTKWCFSIPPRCSVAKQRQKMVLVKKEVPRVRVVPKCCTGYQELSYDKCVPVCSKPCVKGRCTAPEKCSCLSGYGGSHCEKPCEPGTWGFGCMEVCNCHNNATCDRFYGKCFCTPGWQGLRCESPCEPGFYGTNCESRCECGGELCDHESGICATTTEVATTTTESTPSDTTTVTESTVTESSTIAGTTQVEDSTVDDPTSSTNNQIRVYLGEENTDLTYESNETAKDNEIESSQDLTGDEIREFSLSNIFGNLSIICGVFLLIFVVTMSSVMVSHYKKVRKTGYECNGNNNTNTQNFPLHRFYGGSLLPSKMILDNQVCATNVDFRVEQPILMTFKPLPDEKSKADYTLTSVESNTGVFDTDSALARQIVRVRCGEPKSLAYISSRCKSV